MRNEISNSLFKTFNIILSNLLNSIKKSLKTKFRVETIDYIFYKLKNMFIFLLSKMKYLELKKQQQKQLAKISIGLFLNSMLILSFTSFNDPYAYMNIFLALFVNNQVFYKEIIYLILSLILIFSNISFIYYNLSINNKSEKKIFYFFSFLINYIILISPGIHTGRITNFDAMLHLYIVKLLINNYKIPKYSFYGNFLFHKVLASISKFLNINPHSIFIFLPQFFSYVLFFWGMKLIYSKFTFRNEKIEKLMFFINISTPILISFLGGGKPISIIISVFPLLIFLILIFKIKTIPILFITSIIIVNLHIYGYFVVIIISIAPVYIYLIKRLIRKTKNSIVLIIFPLLIITLSFLLLFDKMILFLLHNLPESFKHTQVFINGLYSGSFIQKYNLFSYDNLFDFIYFNHSILGILFFCYFIPLIVFILNQLSYFRIYKYKKKIKMNFEFSLKIFCDFYFSFILISLFFGASLDFWRFSWIGYNLYILLFFNYIQKYNWKNLFNFGLISKQRKNKKNKKQKTNKQTQMISSLLIITMLLSISFSFFSPVPYEKRHYVAADWLIDNTDQQSLILVNLYYRNFIKGITMRDTTINANKLFNENLNYENRYNSFFSYNTTYNYDYLFRDNHSKGYIFLDLSYIQRLDKNIVNFFYGSPGVGYSKQNISFQKLFSILDDSNEFILRYNSSDILIFEIQKQ